MFQHFVDSHRFFTTGYNHILHIFKETVFKALLTFLAKIHMYNVDRKVFLNSRERSRTLHRRNPGVTTRLQSVRDTSEPGDKCDANTTSVFVTYLSPDVTPTRCTCWRYYDVTLFLKCTLPPAGHQEHLLTANFDSEVKCCKFRMNQRRDLLPICDDEITSKAEAWRNDWGIFWSVEIIWVAGGQRKLSIHSVD